MKFTVSFLVILLYSTFTPLSAAADTRVATFAAGCFWCTESDFEKLDGVIEATSGFIDGHTKNPTYKQVSAGNTGYTEAVEVRYDDSKVSYQQLLDHFWKNVDPLDAGGQFCDRGSQYRSGIYYHDEEQKKLAEASRDALDRSGKLPARIVTEIKAATRFYAAEKYHQDYYKKNTVRYKYYRWGCGRDRRLEELWGKSD